MFRSICLICASLASSSAPTAEPPPDPVVAGPVTVVLVDAHYSPAASQLVVVLEVSGTEVLEPNGFRAVYLGPDGQQVDVAGYVEPEEVFPGATALSVLVFPAATPGGTVMYSADDTENDEFEVAIPIPAGGPEGLETPLATVFVVDGHSMDSALVDGQPVVVSPLDSPPNRGDVVVFHEITGGVERDLLKRVVALEGESIEMRNCEVRIDGEVLAEPYLDPTEIGAENLCGGDFGPVVVPEDHVFVMGDNRDGSQDSRVIGPIAIADITGLVAEILPASPS